MKADQIIKNAKIFTSDKGQPLASALVVKDGKFAYVGDEAGLADYEGEVTDLGGKFIMPGIIDSHIHIASSVAFDYTEIGEYVVCDSKQSALEFMAEFIRSNPGRERYRFFLERSFLQGEDISKEDLDAICPDNELLILEGECHSTWVNSKILEKHGITDDTPDPCPGLSCYVRKDGHVTGNALEAAAWNFLFDHLQNNLTDEMIEASVLRWIEFCKEYGVSGVFEAGFPEQNDYYEKILKCLRELDKQGRLPIYIDGSYFLSNWSKLKEAMEETKRFNRAFNTEHLKVHTLKLYMDGTMKIRTASMLTPYEGTDELGAMTYSKEEIAEIIKELNGAGLDLHVHTVGERASRIILDGVELARKELGDDFRVRVTCAHLEVQHDDDLNRFAELGVIANYTPWWHTGYVGDELVALLGEKRANNMYRCKTVWDSGALVTWSCDNVAFLEFEEWSPYLGMEIGMTRWLNEKTRASEMYRAAESFPPAKEKMSIEEMILGYTINGAKQLGIEAAKGSITAGKDADFLVFDKDLLTAEQEGFSFNKPEDVYFSGKKMK